MPRRLIDLNPGSFAFGAAVAGLILWASTSFRLAGVTGDAMAPTYVRGDVVLVSALGYRGNKPRRGDVALLYYPLDPTRLMVDRVIGIEGDAIRIADGRVFLNDAELSDHNYVLDENRGHDNWGPVFAPQGYCFVLGDNRVRSSDSRHIGFVPRRYFWGKVIARVWPLHRPRLAATR
jgi:signal peptidase I